MTETTCFTVKPVGDRAALAVCGSAIGEEVNARVSALNERLRTAVLPGLGETVPAFASLLVHYDPLVTDYATVREALLSLGNSLSVSTKATGKTVELPVCYGGAYGEDLAFVAEHAGMRPDEVIALHSKQPYRIYMLGFLPGFPYLGGLDERLFTPRLQNPRTKIPAGSVGIGGEQTGVYPLASPGGWQLLGRTPMRLFDPDDGGKLLYAAGDRIQFVPVNEDDFTRIAREQHTL